MGKIERILNACPSVVNRVSARLRRSVLERYNYKCAGNVPGIECDYNIIDGLEIDHILPKAIKRVDKPYSLQVLCSNCHTLKTKRYDIPLIKKFKHGCLGVRHLKRHLRRFLS